MYKLRQVYASLTYLRKRVDTHESLLLPSLIFFLVVEKYLVNKYVNEVENNQGKKD